MRRRTGRCRLTAAAAAAAATVLLLGAEERERRRAAHALRHARLARRAIGSDNSGAAIAGRGKRRGELLVESKHVLVASAAPHRHHRHHLTRHGVVAIVTIAVVVVVVSI